MMIFSGVTTIGESNPTSPIEFTKSPHITISVDFRVDWASFELIDGDFHSHSFGGRVKRNDSMLEDN
jgi:hypothetical protein